MTFDYASLNDAMQKVADFLVKHGAVPAPGAQAPIPGLNLGALGGASPMGPAPGPEMGGMPPMGGPMGGPPPGGPGMGMDAGMGMDLGGLLSGMGAGGPGMAGLGPGPSPLGGPAGGELGLSPGAPDESLPPLPGGPTASEAVAEAPSTKRTRLDPIAIYAEQVKLRKLILGLYRFLGAPIPEDVLSDEEVLAPEFAQGATKKQKTPTRGEAGAPTGLKELLLSETPPEGRTLPPIGGNKAMKPLTAPEA